MGNYLYKLKQSSGQVPLLVLAIMALLGAGMIGTVSIANQKKSLSIVEKAATRTDWSCPCEAKLSDGTDNCACQIQNGIEYSRCCKWNGDEDCQGKWGFSKGSCAKGCDPLTGKCRPIVCAAGRWDANRCAMCNTQGTGWTSAADNFTGLCNSYGDEASNPEGWCSCCSQCATNASQLLVCLQHSCPTPTPTRAPETCAVACNRILKNSTCTGITHCGVGGSCVKKVANYENTCTHNPGGATPVLDDKICDQRKQIIPLTDTEANVNDCQTDENCVCYSSIETHCDYKCDINSSDCKTCVELSPTVSVTPTSTSTLTPNPTLTPTLTLTLTPTPTVLVTCETIVAERKTSSGGWSRDLSSLRENEILHFKVTFFGRVDDVGIRITNESTNEVSSYAAGVATSLTWTSEEITLPVGNYHIESFVKQGNSWH